MFRKKHALQSRSEIALRNIVVIFLVVCLLLFTIIPIIVALAGSFHQWNPLNGTYKFIGLANYERLFNYPTFWTAMGNTVIFLRRDDRLPRLARPFARLCDHLQLDALQNFLPHDALHAYRYAARRGCLCLEDYV